MSNNPLFLAKNCIQYTLIVDKLKTGLLAATVGDEEGCVMIFSHTKNYSFITAYAKAILSVWLST